MVMFTQVLSLKSAEQKSGAPTSLSPSEHKSAARILKLQVYVVMSSQFYLDFVKQQIWARMLYREVKTTR